MSFFDGVSARTLEDAPDGFRNFSIGENEAYIDNAEEGYTKDSGRKMLTVTFKKDDGAEIKHYIVDNEWKLTNLKNLYAAFGISFHSTDLADWYHKRGIVVCKEHMHEGKTYPRVSYLKPLPGGNLQQGRSGGSTGSAKPSQGTEQNSQPWRNKRPPADDHFDDDVPF